MIEALETLKKRLSERNTLFAQNENGCYEEVGFEWNSPLDMKEIVRFENENHLVLPSGYKEFLTISNGAVLFKDIRYGQWGCVILPLQKVIETTIHRRTYGQNIKNSWLVFAEWLGDLDVLLFDLDKVTEKKRGNEYIIDGDAGYQTDKWVYIKGSYTDWLDRLIVAQGCKYWQWY